MLQNRGIHPVAMIGPLGELLTLDSLPAANTARWKAEVVAAVNGGSRR